MVRNGQVYKHSRPAQSKESRPNLVNKVEQNGISEGRAAASIKQNANEKS